MISLLAGPALRRGVIPIVALLCTWLCGAATVAASCMAVAGAPPLFVPAAYETAALAPGQVGVTFLGHASFLIESPGGVSIVTDYNGYIKPDFIPDIVTMNHAHSTHYTDFPDPGIKLVLRGWDPAGGVPNHDVTFGDVHIHNVPTNIRDNGGGGTEYAGNSVFVFDIAGLCIAHLSHLHHTLTDEHLAELGPVDVLMVPVDGTWTLSHEDMITVIEQVHPSLIIPMHYFSQSLLSSFLAKTEDRYPVHVSPTPGVVLSRAELPKKPEILVLPGH
jgi:L-ascorbate metabolism protein UlaG (beta-lactamase superfamily)